MPAWVIRKLFFSCYVYRPKTRHLGSHLSDLVLIMMIVRSSINIYLYDKKDAERGVSLSRYLDISISRYLFSKKSMLIWHDMIWRVPGHPSLSPLFPPLVYGKLDPKIVCWFVQYVQQAKHKIYRWDGAIMKRAVQAFLFSIVIKRRSWMAHSAYIILNPTTNWTVLLVSCKRWLFS